jgi:formate dehydrogenase subunit gamma
VSSTADEVLRFQAAERHLHWAIAVPFKICYLTALILIVVYNPQPHRPLREVFSWIHRLSGVCLTLLPPLAIAWHWRDYRVHLHNVRTAWTWSFDDVKWLALMVPAAISSSVSLPKQGKFNAAEKINFMVLTAAYPGYVMTGLTIWFFGPPYLSWLAHFALAATATPLMLGHIFMATINPDTRVGLTGMITGKVDRKWARHHYAHWYAEHHGSTLPEPEREAPASPATIAPASVAPRESAVLTATVVEAANSSAGA